MTIRHHAARLESHADGWAIYAFTPDSTATCGWGRVRYKLADYAHEILELAPDASMSPNWQNSACAALAHKLKQARAADPSSIPDTLVFVA